MNKIPCLLSCCSGSVLSMIIWALAWQSLSACFFPPRLSLPLEDAAAPWTSVLCTWHCICLIWQRWGSKCQSAPHKTTRTDAARERLILSLCCHQETLTQTRWIDSAPFQHQSLWRRNESYFLNLLETMNHGVLPVSTRAWFDCPEPVWDRWGGSFLLLA